MLVLLLGFFLRFAALRLFGPYDVAAADPYNYMQLAESLLAGRGLTFDDAVYGPNLRALYPPVYPIVLAAFGSIAGFSGTALIVMNGLVDAGTALILRRYDIRAAAIYFLWPWNVLGSFLAQKESILCLLVVVLAHIAMQSQRGLRTRAAALFGLISGLAVLTQPGLVFFPLILAAVFFGRSEYRFRSGLIAALGALVVMVPWWIRNWTLFGQFVPLTSAAGLSLAYVVNYGHFPPPDSLKELSEPERFRRVGAIAFEHIQLHPLRYAKAIMEQTIQAGFNEKFALSRVSHTEQSVIVTRFLAAGNMVLLGIAALSRNKDFWRLLAAGALSLVPVIWLEFAERHRYFLLPFVALLSANATRNLPALKFRKQR